MDQTQYVLVMRHGERVDCTLPGWEDTAAQPWNPPLTEGGKEKVKDRRKDLEAFQIHSIYVSPFLRCLETAALLQPGLQDPCPRVTVDPALSEVFSERLLFGDARPTDVSALETWMRSHEAAQQAWADAGGAGELAWRSSSFPNYPESLEDAHARYTAAFEELAEEALGRNILIITHGEAVRRSVLRVEPTAMVYEVDYAGWTVSWRVLKADDDHDDDEPAEEVADDSKNTGDDNDDRDDSPGSEEDTDTWGQWQLQQPDAARGVAWL